jgi:hypothetical protein
MKTTGTTISTMNQNPPKATGMPLASKIALILLLLTVTVGFGYNYVFVKIPAQNPTTKIAPAPVEKMLFHKGEVITAKCKDFNNISLYLESDLTKNEYGTVLRAVATIPSSVLVIPSQELTFKSISPYLKIRTNFKVYKCQVSNGVLMGKVVITSKTPM